MDAARHAGAQRAALEAMDAEKRGVEAGARDAGLDDLGHRPGVDAMAPTRGRGYCSRPGRAAGSRSAGTPPLGDPGVVLPSLAI
jgi:hypothetical protein